MSFVCTKYDAFICINKKKPLSGQSKNVNGHIKYSSTCHRQNLENLQFFNNHDHHTHSHCLIYFGSVFENYSSLFLSVCVCVCTCRNLFKLHLLPMLQRRY
jgi:hypothetical protein